MFGLGALELLIIGSSLAAISRADWHARLDRRAGAGLCARLFVDRDCAADFRGRARPWAAPALSMLLFEDIMIVPIIFILGAAGARRARRWLGRPCRDIVAGPGFVIAILLVAGRLALPRLFGARPRAPRTPNCSSPLHFLGGDRREALPQVRSACRQIRRRADRGAADRRDRIITPKSK